MTSKFVVTCRAALRSQFAIFVRHLHVTKCFPRLPKTDQNFLTRFLQKSMKIRIVKEIVLRIAFK